MKQIILINGKAQHGKDTTATILKEKLGEDNTLILHFADYLKYIATAYMGWNGEKDNKGRTLLQWLGTDKIRHEMKKPLYWAEKVCDIIEILSEKYDYFIVPDTRFFNEIFLVKALFPACTTTLRVNRLNYDNGLNKEQQSHLSEVQLDSFEFDYQIYAENGIDNLEREINFFIGKVL